ncbi:MAG: cytidine deaminase, partial [Microcystaceae cyanobacterium]
TLILFPIPAPLAPLGETPRPQWLDSRLPKTSDSVPHQHENCYSYMSLTLTLEEKQNLCQKAQQVAQLAYAPYSKFRVGAAILGWKNIYVGTNVENASYGLSLCAERSALATAIAQGERNFRAIAIACIDAKNEQDIQRMVPCGACRQWIAELATTAEIIICGANHSFCLEDLLPMSFQLKRKYK